MKTEPAAPPIVLDLVERFDRNRDACRSPDYNETQVRREFIDPLFAALGWDVWNEGGLAQAYKDVIHEDAIKVGGVTKAPDYCFRIGGTRKFFLEAKKPAVGIRDDPEPAYQLRRYAWSARLPLSILTDFEELAVYDCRFRPNRGDPASKARTVYMTCGEYPDRWDELASIFSKDAVLKGSFDKYAESTRRKRGTAPVDAEFLREIEQWRDELARNFALRNPELSVRDLNFAVQRTIDRIVFLRMCEDRGIERYGQLQTLLNGEQTYARLAVFFRQADDRYNSSLFYFRAEKHREPPDELTLSLRLDDRVLKDILGRLYYPESPYEFSVLPTEILGQVYEQFLGKVIRLTPGHRAVVEEKPEVRKAGGVYYTPTYIVDYIVQHTVGKLVEGKTPQQVGGLTENYQPSKAKGVRPLAVLDPACGSGSFLLGAYQFLLAWYRDRYLEDDPRAHTTARRPRLFQHSSGEWRLTTGERKRILLAHIHGVDIDSQAVETTKLSLLLKVLEGETAETVGSNLRLFQERALPDLDRNIKCGNSLIGPDFYDGRQLDMFDDEQRYRINAFDWPAEFPEIFPNRAPNRAPTRRSDAVARPGDDSPGSAHSTDSGFDAVIGNPPYIRMEAFKELKDYLRLRYHVHDERTDLYVYFIEREHELLRNGGLFGMIVSNKFLRAKYGANVRQLLGRVSTIRRIVDLAGLPVFGGATVRTIVLITYKGKETSPTVYYPPPPPLEFREIVSGNQHLEEVVARRETVLGDDSLQSDRWTLTSSDSITLINRLVTECCPLAHWLKVPICYGVKSGLVEAFVIPAAIASRLRRTNAFARSIVRPYVTGRQIRRYDPLASDQWLIYTPHGIDLSEAAAIVDHLRPYKSRLEQRATAQKWYELQQPQARYVQLMGLPKIVYPDISQQCRFTLDTRGHICGDTTFAIPQGDLELLGILNSRMALFYFNTQCAALEGATESYLRFKQQYVSAFPIPRKIDPRKTILVTRLVQRMLDLHKRLPLAKTAHEKTALQRQIDATDRQIDKLVYELYDLTDDEIRIVEEATQ
jgi:hypothetical protein